MLERLRGGHRAAGELSCGGTPGRDPHCPPAAGERGLAAPELLAHERDGDVTRVELRLAGRRWAVRVATRRTPARQLTCRAASSSEALEHSLLGIEPLDG